MSDEPQEPEERSSEQRVTERNQALVWLEERWATPHRCPVCGNENWAIGDVVEARLYEGGGLKFGALYPYVPVTCTTCGNTLFFNAIMMGLIRANGSV